MFFVETPNQKEMMKSFSNGDLSTSYETYARTYAFRFYQNPPPIFVFIRAKGQPSSFARCVWINWRSRTEGDQVTSTGTDCRIVCM